MTPTDYVTAAARTDLLFYHRVCDRFIDSTESQQAQVPQLVHAVLGVTSEAGELADAAKKYLMYGKNLDATNLIEETGDLLWYLALLSRAVGFTLEEAMEKNIAKLQARYPEKFTEEQALQRDLSKERSVLEKVEL